MANYLITNRAVEDLTEIWEYTVLVWSERQAIWNSKGGVLVSCTI